MPAVACSPDAAAGITEHLALAASAGGAWPLHSCDFMASTMRSIVEPSTRIEKRTMGSKQMEQDGQLHAI
jgi:hypothetical protein